MTLPGRNDPCWCGSGRKYKACHMQVDNRIALAASQGHEVPTHAMLKTPEQLEGIRRSAKINVAVLDEIARVIRPGMATGEIDRIVRTMTYH